jgi:hypothetical protein
MSRTDFLKKAIRYILLIVMAAIVLALSNKVVTGRNCNGCPGNGICSGKTE